MTWIPTYRADYTKFVIKQLLAFAQRDQRDALDYVGGVGTLPSIVTYQTSPVAVPQFPGVLIAPERATFDHQAVGTRHYATIVTCVVIVQHQDPQIIVDLAEDYLRALDLIFCTVPISDFHSSWPLQFPTLSSSVQQTVPLADGTVQELFVSSHNYDDVRKMRDKFTCTASLELLIEREES